MVLNSIEQAVDFVDSTLLEQDVVLQVAEIGNTMPVYAGIWDGHGFKRQQTFPHRVDVMALMEGRIIYALVSDRDEGIIRDMNEQFSDIKRPFPICAISYSQKLLDVCGMAGKLLLFETFSNKFMGYDSFLRSRGRDDVIPSGEDFYLVNSYWLRKFGNSFTTHRIPSTQFCDVSIIPEGIFSELAEEVSGHQEKRQIVRVENKDGETVYHPAGTIDIGKGLLHHLQATTAGKTFYYAKSCDGPGSIMRYDAGKESRPVLNVKDGHYIASVHFFPKGSIS